MRNCDGCACHNLRIKLDLLKPQWSETTIAGRINAHSPQSLSTRIRKPIEKDVVPLGMSARSSKSKS